MQRLRNLLRLTLVLATVGSPLVIRLEARQDEPSSRAVEDLQREAIASYAAHAHQLYATCQGHAEVLLDALKALVAEPSEEHLTAARKAWLAGRRDYGKTEALRFYGGPIDDDRDGVETLLNAWPLDEAYIDYVQGGEHPGIIGDEEQFPNLSGPLLQLLNERGGEANVSVGWHAVEFLLWGQDNDPLGPGARPWRDFEVGTGRHAQRRGEYLLRCGELLVEHHKQLTREWNPKLDENYQARFVSAEPQESFRKILAGMTILSGFELSGERLAVAYETRDQEEEHSCFSDNTHIDFISDQEGILEIYHGSTSPDLASVAEVARLVDADLAERLELQLQESLEAIKAMPVPFDQAILGEDDDAGRVAVLRALIALEEQSRTLSTLALVMGYEIAIQPGG